MTKNQDSNSILHIFLMDKLPKYISGMWTISGEFVYHYALDTESNAEGVAAVSNNFLIEVHNSIANFKPELKNMKKEKFQAGAYQHMAIGNI